MQSDNPAAKSVLQPAALIATGTFIVITIASWLLTDSIPQNPDYHLFADQRSLIDIPHAHNVLSNLPFCLVALFGFFTLATRRAQLQNFMLMYLVFFAAILFTGFGSAYYHFNPTNLTLVWDRLPMSIGFMSFLAIVVSERLDPKLGRALFPWLVIAGIGSVFYWHWLDDLRPYALVQFGSLLALPLILLIYRRPDSALLWLALALYVLAKVFEAADTQIFTFSASWISGHALKHLAAAITPLLILLRLRLLTNETENNTMINHSISKAEMQS